CDGQTLSFEQCLFSLVAPTITAQTSVFANHPMAGDNQRNRVRRDRTSNCSRSRGSSYFPGYLAVGSGAAVRNLTQLLPHAPLKRRRLHIQRQIEMRTRAFEMTRELLDPTGQSFIAALNVGGG